MRRGRRRRRVLVNLHKTVIEMTPCLRSLQRLLHIMVFPIVLSGLASWYTPQTQVCLLSRTGQEECKINLGRTVE